MLGVDEGRSEDKAQVGRYMVRSAPRRRRGKRIGELAIRIVDGTPIVGQVQTDSSLRRAVDLRLALLAPDPATRRRVYRAYVSWRKEIDRRRAISRRPIPEGWTDLTDRKLRDDIEAQLKACLAQLARVQAQVDAVMVRAQTMYRPRPVRRAARTPRRRARASRRPRPAARAPDGEPAPPPRAGGEPVGLVCTHQGAP